MNKQKIIVGCDRSMVFGLCALIYFLPISLALVKSFAWFVTLVFFVKRSVALSAAIQLPEPCRGPRFSSRILQFLMAFKPLCTPLNRPIAIFVLACLLSSLMSQYPHLSWEGFFFKLIQNILLYVCFMEAVNSGPRLKAFLTVFLISLTLVSIDGLSQAFWGIEFIRGHNEIPNRVYACFKQANDFASYLIVGVVLTLSILLFWFFSKDYVPKVFYGKGKMLNWSVAWAPKIWVYILFLLLITCLGLTYSRGAWLGFFLALALIGFQRPKSIPVLFFIAIFFWIIFFPNMKQSRNVSFVSDNVELAGNEQFSGMGRIHIWKEAIAIIRDYPVFGCGLNTYTEIGPKYKVDWGGYPHNCYLQMAAETGLVGLLAFLWLVFNFFKEALKALSRAVNQPFWYSVLLGLAAGVAGFLFHSFLDTNLYSVQLTNLFWATIATAMAIQKYVLPSDSTV